MFILTLQFLKELEEYISVFTRIGNPIYLAIFIIFVFCITVYLFLRYIIIPLQRSHRTEKETLEKKNLQLLALFAELSPDPLLRLDMNGYIIDANNAANQLSSGEDIKGMFIDNIIHSKINLKKDFQGESFQGIHEIQNRSYSFYIKKIPTEEIVLLYLRDITDSLEYEKKLKEVMRFSQDQLENERQRIAIELHDGVGQNLSLSRLILFNLIKKYNNIIQPEELSRLNNILDNAIKELKNISYNLKPRVLDEMGLAPAIIVLCNSVDKESGIKIHSDIKGMMFRLPSLIEANLYRITQEAISNVIKHAGASQCIIHLEYNPGYIKLIISDDGIGFNYHAHQNTNKKSLGLFSIRQRVENMNGKFIIESAPGQGTILYIDIPPESISYDD